MAAEKALALVLRTTDWSETSRIATLWTREFGKVRVLAKGGRRLKSNFENSLDLLTLCRIVFLRKSSGSLDLLTEARVEERFPRLRADLPALYAAYYIAELLSDWTEDYDPHPLLFDEALAALRTLGQPDIPSGPRLARFELVLLRELGYTPALLSCAVCGREFALPQSQESGVRDQESASLLVTPDSCLLTPDSETSVAPMAFSAAAGGVVCADCRPRQRNAMPLSTEAWLALQDLSAQPEAWRRPMTPEVRGQLREVLNQYVTYLLGRRPKLLPYLRS
jgi:DNA repair protein RecO (recombination protein O)